MKDPAARKISSCAVVIYCLLVLARLYLTSHDEIIPTGADSAHYAAATTGDLWFHEELGGVAFAARVMRGLGLPYKLALDAAYMALCFVASRRIALGTQSELLGLLSFYLLAFSSYFLQASLTFSSDPLTACCLLAAALIFSRLVERPMAQWHWRDGIIGGFVLALWAATRPEVAIIVSSAGLLAALIFLLQRYHWRQGWSGRALIFVLPLLMMLAGKHWVQHENEVRHHVAATSRMDGPGEMALLNALYSIPPQRELRFSPVPRETLEAAAKVSPTMRPLLPQLIDPKNILRLYASDRYQIPDEVCTWLNFLLLDVYQTQYPVDNGAADLAMLRTAREIRAAQARGELGRRAALYPIDPLWRSWLPDLPKTLAWSLWSSLALHYRLFAPEQVPALRAEVLALTDVRNFNDGLLLRSALNNQTDLDVSGVVVDPKRQSAATSVLLRGPGGVIGASAVYPFTNFLHPARFNIVTRTLAPLPSGTLEFWDASHLLQSVPIAVPGDFLIPLAGGKESWKIVSRQDAPTPSFPRRLQTALLHVSDGIFACGLLVCFGIGVCRASACTPAQLFSVAALLVTAAAFVLPRLFLYSLLHVWVHWDTLRYFSACAPAAQLALLISGVLAGVWLGRRFGVRRFAR